MSPTARTLSYLRKNGWLAARVEIFVAAVKRHRDLFGLADCLAVHPKDRQVLLVQCTSRDHVADRLKRVLAQPDLPGLLQANVLVEVWGWAKRGGHWTVERVRVGQEHLNGVPPVLPRRKRGGKQRLLF